MQIRWKIVFLIAVLALGLTSLLNRKTATAAAPQAASAVKAPPAAQEREGCSILGNLHPRHHAGYQLRQAHVGARSAL